MPEEWKGKRHVPAHCLSPDFKIIALICPTFHIKSRLKDMREAYKYSYVN